MKTPRRNDDGFTVIELLLVIVIVCILAAVVALTVSGVQAKNRNAARQKNIDTMKTQLEDYYAQTNTYPTLGEINDPVWLAKYLPHLSQANLQDPRWSKSAAACSKDGKPIAASGPAANC